MSDYKVDQETAENDFDRMCEEFDIDVDTKFMDQDDLDSFNSLKRLIVKSIMKGSLIINENALPSYTYMGDDNAAVTIDFKEPTGASIQEMDKHKAHARITQTYAILGSLTGKQPKFYSKMKYKHMKVLQAIMMLFLG